MSALKLDAYPNALGYRSFVLKGASQVGARPQSFRGGVTGHFQNEAVSTSSVSKRNVYAGMVFYVYVAKSSARTVRTATAVKAPVTAATTANSEVLDNTKKQRRGCR